MSWPVIAVLVVGALLLFIMAERASENKTSRRKKSNDGNDKPSPDARMNRRQDEVLDEAEAEDEGTLGFGIKAFKRMVRSRIARMMITTDRALYRHAAESSGDVGTAVRRAEHGVTQADLEGLAGHAVLRQQINGEPITADALERAEFEKRIAKAERERDWTKVQTELEEELWRLGKVKQRGQPVPKKSPIDAAQEKIEEEVEVIVGLQVALDKSEASWKAKYKDNPRMLEIGEAAFQAVREKLGLQN